MHDYEANFKNLHIVLVKDKVKYYTCTYMLLVMIKFSLHISIYAFQEV